ncbi:MAG: SusC/RagA family TonB-linked outer membrane protein [Cytophagales bacterium]|nr:SusC/RagA family TonB-linked outer membrane protein [Cytophagales bacterium]
MKKYLLMLLSMFFVLSVWAQGTTVTGQVTDGETGETVPGANVIEKGTTNGTTTDLDGNFALNVSEGATLVVSFVGYRQTEVVVGSRSVIDVALELDVAQLAEVVVVGYGTQEKKEITSAVASVSAEDFNQGNITDPTQLLQGKVAGLSITRPGGNPNGGYNIRLRGLSTFGGNSSPLIVIDGVIGASLDNIDPADIESMDVLKDGSAAAIYGTRGSSGVILVTTKSGKKGQTSVDYNAFVAIEQVANKIDVLSASEFVAQGGTNDGSDTDWFEELTETGISHTHNISLSGGNNNTQYRASVNYRDRQSVASGHGFSRLNTRINVQHSMFDNRVRFTFNGSFANRDQEEVPIQAFRYALIFNPTSPVFDPNAEQFGGYFQNPDNFDFFNPVAIINQDRSEEVRKNLLTSYGVEWDILDDLTFSARYSQDRESAISGRYISRFSLFGGGVGENGIASRGTYDDFDDLFETTLSYNTTFNNIFDVTLLGGYSYQKRRGQGFGVTVNNFQLDNFGIDNLFAGIDRDGNQTGLGSGRSQDQIIAYFGRLNVNIDGTYFLSASWRNEGYSGFGENNQRANFFAVSGGVELTNLIDVPVLSNLKFRAGYGETGNLPPGPYLSLPTVTANGRTVVNGQELRTFGPTRNANPNLSWETKKEINIGIDFSLLDYKLNGTIDYYNRTTSDLIFNSPVSVGSPNPNLPGTFNVANNTWLNLGEIENSGLEFALSYAAEFGDLTWTPAVNGTFYDQSVLNSLSNGEVSNSEFFIGNPGSPGQNDDRVIRVAEGQRIGDFWGPIFEGVDESGEYIFRDLNGDGVIDTEDETVVGNGLQSFDLGINNTLAWKNWDLNIFLRGSFGHELYNQFRGFYENRDAGSNTWNSVVTDKTDPNITAAPQFSSLYVEKGDFLRLDNMTLGYTLPGNDIYKKLRLYFSGQNLFTITDYAGLDPEVRYNDSGDGDNPLAPGIERRDTFFTTVIYTFGFNMTF